MHYKKVILVILLKRQLTMRLELSVSTALHITFYSKLLQGRTGAWILDATFHSKISYELMKRQELLILMPNFPHLSLTIMAFFSVFFFALILDLRYDFLSYYRRDRNSFKLPLESSFEKL